MPNGKNEGGEYNAAWCREKHKEIDRDMGQLREKIDMVESKLWYIVILLFANLGGIIGLFLNN